MFIRSDAIRQWSPDHRLSMFFFLNTTNHEQSHPQQPPQDPLRQTQPSIRPRLCHAPSHRERLHPHAIFFLLFLPCPFILASCLRLPRIVHGCTIIRPLSCSTTSTEGLCPTPPPSAVYPRHSLSPRSLPPSMDQAAQVPHPPWVYHALPLCIVH